MRRQPALVGAVVTACLLLLATNSDHWRSISTRGLPTLRWSAPQSELYSNLCGPTSIQNSEDLRLGTRTQPTDLGTTTPSVPYALGSDLKVGAHTWGYSVLDRLYLRNGTFYIVTSDRDSLPTKAEIIHRLGRISTQGDEDDEGSELVKYISPAESRGVLGDFATVISGVSFLILDPPRYLAHFFHYWGEVLLGAWRVYSSLALSSDPSLINSLPFPSRFVFPFVDNGEWRDRADLNGPLMRLAFPDVHIVKSDVWGDWIKTGGTIVFERSVTVNRVSAHKSSLASIWFKMLSSTQNITVPNQFWEPIRKSVSQQLWGYAPQVTNSGRPASTPRLAPNPDATGIYDSLPIVTYISRQTTGRRLIDSHHEELVAALRLLEIEGVCTVRIPVMEKLTLKEQLAEVASSTILLGVHGNGLTHQIFMPPSLRSAVIEMQPPGDYAFDYWMLARNMGHKHFMVQNDTVTTYRPGEWHNGIHIGENFHSNNIPVSGSVVADLIRERLMQMEEKVED
ncbi:hypothetical protein FA13DRAFT_1726446 [Coprinellus micaceus]|uniref:Glycosyltransferase 61 catalytic domain-containing protein n=1 Tax=Coprinellus micaceus TaxID=71717 RepID=A0A4Y7TT72_COPMI|nr:hypothetical protein FA13DRAFT_1726446 [Coprinellus micaceus]